jgi:hypothetical protein
MDAILTAESRAMSEDAFLPYVYNGGDFEQLYRREYPNLVAVAISICPLSTSNSIPAP